MNRPKIPFEIIIEITGKCRLACSHCTGNRTPHVPLKTILGVLDEAANWGVKAIRITGGEPLLHPHIETILNYTKQKEFMVIMNTAAENISPTLLKTILETVNLMFISLQGYTERTNRDYTHSKSPFLTKIKNIFFLKKHLPTIVLGTVITPAMALSFTKFIPLIKKINPASWVLLRPISRNNDEKEQGDLSFYRALAAKIMKARQHHLNVYIGNPIPLCLTGNLDIGKQAFFGANLDDGHVRLVYSAEGYYKPSYFITQNLGNTLQKAWAHPFLKELDCVEHLPNPCHECPVLETCRGGSRAMALRKHGVIFSPDPLFDLASAQKALSKPYLKSPRP